MRRSACGPLPSTLIPEILARVRECRAAVVTAAPGAGKTTRVPPALAVDGPVIVLQPRRVAARSLASRIAANRAGRSAAKSGGTSASSASSARRRAVLFATEGILTARLQQDPLLGDFRTIILDEFHERSMHADLGIALAKQAWLARSDLRLVVMSATLDAAAVSAYLDGCPIVDVPGPRIRSRSATRQACRCPRRCRRPCASSAGQVLCFLPGAGEIARARAGSVATPDVEVVELHGSLDSAAQDAAIAATPRRRIVLATNIAETSLTVPGITAVVDSGFQKVARYDPDRAVDSLETERISQDAADQRAGRAGRIGPGLAIRLWHQADRLRAHREPEIQRVDLSGTVLDILAWGGEPARVRVVRGAGAGPRGRGARAPRSPRGHARRAPDRRRATDAEAAAQPTAVSDPPCRVRRARRGPRLRAALGASLPSPSHARALASDHHERSAERHRARRRSAASTC